MSAGRLRPASSPCDREVQADTPCTVSLRAARRSLRSSGRCPRRSSRCGSRPGGFFNAENPRRRGGAARMMSLGPMLLRVSAESPRILRVNVKPAATQTLARDHLPGTSPPHRPSVCPGRPQEWRQHPMHRGNTPGQVRATGTRDADSDPHSMQREEYKRAPSNVRPMSRQQSEATPAVHRDADETRLANPSRPTRASTLADWFGTQQGSKA